jgi:tetratricopeptide (TPR) repeat protein
MMMSEDKYRPCPCGSGKKFKFCCDLKRAALDGMSDRELIRRSAEFPVSECWITSEWQEKGLADVFIVRQTPDSKYIVAACLTDVFCLGVKNTLAGARFTAAAVRGLLAKAAAPIERISYENARSVVLGAVEYARQLGFEPHPNWENTAPIVESARPFARKFEFGKDGKPFYIQGPHDDAGRIMARLAPLVKEEKADFLIVPDSDTLKDEGRLEEWCDSVTGLLEEKRLGEARGEIEEMIEEFPDYAEPHYFMGTCLAMEGKAAEAIVFLNRALSIEPSAEAYFNLANVHKALFQIAECVDCLKKAIARDGKKGDLGRQAKAALDEIASTVRKTSGLTMDRFLENKARFDRAFACLKAGRFEDAIQGFHHVLSVQPSHVQSHGNLGLAYAGLGNHEKAIAHLERAIELDPDYQPAIENLNVVRTAQPGERVRAASFLETDFYAEKAGTR